MIKDLEQLAAKYQKIAELALQLKQEKFILYNQIDNLQQQLTLLVEDKLQLEKKNNFLTNQLKQLRQSLSGIIDNVYWEDPSDFALNHKNTNVLQPANSNLSFAAAAAAAAIGIDDMNMSAAILEQNSTENSILSKAVSELENIQQQVIKNLDTDKDKSTLIPEINEQEYIINQSLNKNEETGEKMHYGMIKSNNNNSNN